MKHIKKIFISMKEIIITYILSYLIIIVSSAIYTLQGNEDLTVFLNQKLIYVLMIYYIITITYLYRKNYHKESNLSSSRYLPLMSLGISLAIFLNMLIFKIQPPTTITKVTLPILISSGIVGPIFEEILFRYLLYNRLKESYSLKIAMFITTIIFALSHLIPIKIIYAFIMGLFLVSSYEQDNNILSPIIIHVFANTIVLFLQEYNTYILLLSFFCLIISIKNTYFIRKIAKNNKKI